MPTFLAGLSRNCLTVLAESIGSAAIHAATHRQDLCGPAGRLDINLIVPDNPATTQPFKAGIDRLALSGTRSTMVLLDTCNCVHRQPTPKIESLPPASF